MWISSFTDTPYLRDYPFPIAYSWHPCQRLAVYIWIYFCSIGLCGLFCFLFFLASAILFGLLYTIGWNQEVWCIQLSSISRFLWLFGVCVKNLHTDFRIFLYFCKRCHWHSMGITLNQYIALGSIDILTINLTMLI